MFHNVVVAGTFDRLHVGHKVVLSRAFAEGERVTIGLTTDAFVRRYKLDKLAQLDTLDIKEYSERKKALVLWLSAQNYAGRASIVPLDDPYGFVVPQSSHDVAVPDVDAIVVSSETRPRAEEINRLRIEAGWKPLAIVEVAMVPAEDLQPISSTRVRQGRIDQEGKLVMPDNLRPELAKPLGRVLTGEDIGRSIMSHLANQGETFAKLITVGDVATKTLLDAGFMPSLAIIDGRVGRRSYPDCYEAICKAAPYKGRQIRIKSGPGFISKEAVKTIRDCLSYHPSRVTHHVILVDGEEDLLALPAIAQAPIGSVVYYGQPPLRPDEHWGFEGQAHGGLVEVVVTEEKRQEAIALLAQFLS